MSDEIEAVGAFATAGLVANSLSRRTGVTHEQDHPGTCANCAFKLTGPYCSNCGQRAHVHRSLLHMAEEMVHGIAHFDGKVWRTLPLLVFKPGKLTRDYIEGRRATYVSPMALFLFVVFLMFVIFSFLPKATSTPLVIDPNTKAGRDIAASFRDQAVKAKARLEADSAAGRDTIAANEIANSWSVLSASGGLAAGVKDGMPDFSEIDVKDMGINTGWPALDEKVKHYAGNPELLIYKLKNTAYKFSFLLVPISLPFIWLLFFWRRDVGMYDHAVFALYSLCFMSLLFTLIAVGTGWDWASWAIFGSLLAFAPPVHMYAQLKGAYGLGWFGAATRTFALLVFSSIALTLFAIAIIALGVSG